MKKLTYQEVLHKLEYYCSYQERCHQEVHQKLKSFYLTSEERENIIVHLIEHNYLNEERFAELFTLSKFHQKKWGKKRIESELKARNIGDYLIRKSLTQIPEEEYRKVFEEQAQKTWDSLTETQHLKKHKRWQDTLFRKGFESDSIHAYYSTFLKK
ncbi:MAG: regulatory protein RecX [Flavobacterium sp.]